MFIQGTLNFQDVESLVNNNVTETIYLEYKKTYKDENSKEIAKDISAFANAYGGHILVGISEEKGLPTGIVGIENTELDSEKQRIESIIRDAIEPSIIRYNCYSLAYGDDKQILVIAIAQSNNAPHRVSTGGHNRFWVRHSSGKAEASLEQLRELFTMSINIQERIESFRRSRLEKIDINPGAHLDLANRMSGFILHIFPLNTFGKQNIIDPETASSNYRLLIPIGRNAAFPTYNIDGLKIITGGSTESYTQVFRDGTIESLNTPLVRGDVNNRYVSSYLIVDNFINYTGKYLEAMQAMNIPSPLAVLVTLFGMTNAYIASKYVDEDEWKERTFDRDVILTSEVIIDNYNDNLEEVLTPIQNQLWNACGYPKCHQIDGQGKWMMS